MGMMAKKRKVLEGGAKGREVKGKRNGWYRWRRGKEWNLIKGERARLCEGRGKNTEEI